MRAAAGSYPALLYPTSYPTHPLATKAAHQKVSRLEDLKYQGSGTLRPIYTGIWLFFLNLGSFVWASL